MAVALGATDERPASADRLPTLTEVVELGREGGEPAPPAEAAMATPAAAAPTAQAAVFDEDRLVGLVLAELAPRIDLLLESRLREALAPALARAADGLIRDARDELATTLRSLVEETVARSLDRRPPR